jgi:hypothetical protein
MNKIDLTAIPEGGWTPANTKAYKDEWWRQELARPASAWEGITDPEGRLKRGQRIRWAHDQWGDGEGDMEVMYLCAPTGLYSRPLRDGDEEWRVEHAALCGGGLTPCEKDEPGAVYRPERLMVSFRYIYSDSATTGQAIHLVVVADTVGGGRAQP